MSLLNNKKLIILDRDGVINHDSDEYIKSADEWIPISGSLEAISKLNKAAYKVAVATNQSGIARGYYSVDTLNEMHQKMQNLLADNGGKIDHIAYCPHGPNDGCRCRKPKAGMLLDIMDTLSIKPCDTIFIGDTLTDMQAAKAAGVDFALVKTGKGLKTLQILKNKEELDKNYSIYNSLQAFTCS